ncbi:MAG: dethiobiotin synthase, partial [Verrucomicrobiota bacterium]
MNLFITGTNTGVGKTYVSTLICKALAERGDRVAPFKPIVCGERDDAERLLAASGRDGLTVDDVNPLHFKSPVSPMTASMIENREIEIDDLVQKARELEADSDHMIVEGVGGWEVPIS